MLVQLSLPVTEANMLVIQTNPALLTVLRTSTIDGMSELTHNAMTKNPEGLVATGRSVKTKPSIAQLHNLMTAHPGSQAHTNPNASLPQYNGGFLIIGRSEKSKIRSLALIPGGRVLSLRGTTGQF